MARDDFDDIEEDDEGNKTVRLPEDQAKGLREKARKADELANAATERDAAQRELAFLKAGVNPDSAIGKLFTKGYDGELSVEAIKAAAAEIPGLTEAPVDAPPELTPEQQAEAEAEARQTQERNNLSRGAAGYGEAPAPDPRKVAAEAVGSARQAGRNEMDSLALGFSELVNAAGHGDSRARVAMPWDRTE